MYQIHNIGKSNFEPAFYKKAIGSKWLVDSNEFHFDGSTHLQVLLGRYSETDTEFSKVPTTVDKR